MILDFYVAMLPITLVMARKGLKFFFVIIKFVYKKIDTEDIIFCSVIKLFTRTRIKLKLFILQDTPKVRRIRALFL